MDRHKIDAHSNILPLTTRAAHKWFARFMMLLGWVTCFLGLQSITSDPLILAAFAIPLIAVAPSTLL